MAEIDETNQKSSRKILYCNLNASSDWLVVDDSTWHLIFLPFLTEKKIHKNISCYFMQRWQRESPTLKYHTVTFINQICNIFKQELQYTIGRGRKNSRSFNSSWRHKLFLPTFFKQSFVTFHFWLQKKN